MDLMTVKQEGHDAHVEAWLTHLFCLAVSDDGIWPQEWVDAARMKLDARGFRGDVYH